MDPIKADTGRKLTGTARYASINVHLGLTRQKRRSRVNRLRVDLSVEMKAALAECSVVMKRKGIL